MLRTCQPELLDSLPADDPGAIGSRRDLRRLNFWMGNARFITNALRSFLPNKPEQKILEIGAGDGSLLLKIASRLDRNSSRRTAILLDRQEIVTSTAHAQFQALNWELETVKADIFEFLQNAFGRTSSRESPFFYDAIVANLFLHHFSTRELTDLFRLAQRRTSLLIAVEPRRSALSLLAGRFVWAIGCNAVTRHDAMVSIRAGFSGHELSSLWPQGDGWICEERSAGLFSHLFIARRPPHALSARGEGRSEGELLDFSI